VLFNTRLLCTCALAVIVASPAVSTAGRAETSSQVSLAKIGIDNFGQVDEHYYRGEQPEGHDYADLAALGIKTVIDLQADGTNDGEAGLVAGAGMRFYRIPMTTRVAPTAEQLARFLQVVNDPAQQPVYVHCKGGRHRTGVMTAVYRIEHDGWTGSQAFREMKQYRFGSDFLHPEFKQFVYAYQPLNRRVAPQPSVVAASVAG
jgi:tyrosine-protein phosphatase SIW14